MNLNLTNINIPLEGNLSTDTSTVLTDNIRAILGVQKTELDISNSSLNVIFDSRFLSLSSLKVGIERSGYSIKSNNVTLNVSGMTCGACVNHVESAILTVPNTLQASVNLATEKATIEYISDSPSDYSLFITAVNEAGYSAAIPGTLDEEIERLNKNEEIQQLKTRLTVSFLGAIFIFITTMGFLPWNNLTSSIPYIELYCLVIASVIQFWCGYGFYHSGIRSLINLSPNMNSLIMIGTSVAYGYSVFLTIINVSYVNPTLSSYFSNHLFFDTSTMIITLVLVGKYLETIAKVKTSQSIRQLIQLRPPTATILKDDQQLEVKVEDISPGDVILVRPGEAVPIDGEILSGTTSIDESMLTGESLPQDKVPGNFVYTGTLNYDGAITIVATKNPKESLLSQIISLVEEAQGSKAPVQILADKISSVFVPAILLIGLLAFVGWGILGPEPTWILASTSFISILIIACPCALGLATPTAIVTSTGQAAQQGILIKDAQTLEELRNIDTIIFDKTGTLTEGTLQVSSVESVAINQDELIQIAGSIETYSEHPVGKAIVQHLISKNLDFLESTNFKSLPGLGVTGTINTNNIAIGNERLMESMSVSIPNTQEKSTRVYISINNEYSGVLNLNDQIKSSASPTIQSLITMGKNIILASGDNEHAVKHTADIIGIQQYYSQMSPQNKFELVSDLQIQGHKVLMIGDGVNDAPALIQSDVSMAIGQGSDITIENSKITLLKPDLTSILKSLRLSTITSRIIKQNLFWAFFYNLVLIPVAAGILYPIFTLIGYNPVSLSFIFGDSGFLNPVMAALAMALSSITVISNSLRIKTYDL